MAVKVQHDAVITRSIFSSQNIFHSSPVRARYWIYFVGSNCDLYFASVTAVMYAISCYIGPGYNGTRLYIGFLKIPLITRQMYLDQNTVVRAHEEPLLTEIIVSILMSMHKYVFNQDVDDICWLHPIISYKMRHVIGLGSLSTTVIRQVIGLRK